jgi:uroporphyrinogen-III synthase
MSALANLKILVPESRELDLFVTMLESEQAIVLRCPPVQILDLQDTGAAEDWIDQCITDAFDDITCVTPYRYASEAEAGQVVEVIHALAAGKIGMIAFTATPQIERLIKVAQESGLADELARGMARTPVASIGPIVDDVLHKHGCTVTVRPQSSFHLKPLVRAIMAWRQA